MSNKSFCIYPWIHVQVKPNGQAKPCCRFDHMHEAYLPKDQPPMIKSENINDKSFREIMDGKFWEDVRRDMLEDKVIPGCHKCDAEDAGGGSYSMRFNANLAWNGGNEVEPVGQNANKQFRFLELTTGRHCNLACRMCNSDLSTSWDNDDRLLSVHWPDRKDFSDRVKILDLPFETSDFDNVSIIKMTGGEPMLSPSFGPFLDKLVASPNVDKIQLQIYTNASWVPKASIMNKLSKIGIVQLYLSIDGLDSVNDYVRYPSEWPTVEEAAGKWIIWSKANPNVDVIFSPTISLYNIKQLPEMWYWWMRQQRRLHGSNFVVNRTPYNKYQSEGLDDEERGTTHTGFIYEVARFSPTILHTPYYLSPTLLPDAKPVADALQRIIDEERRWVNDEDQFEVNTFKRFEYMIKHLINSLSKEPKSTLQEFIEYTADLDKLRKQNIAQALPDLWADIKDQVHYKGRIG